jgi:hypothetical protein
VGLLGGDIQSLSFDLSDGKAVLVETRRAEGPWVLEKGKMSPFAVPGFDVGVVGSISFWEVSSGRACGAYSVLLAHH